MSKWLGLGKEGKRTGTDLVTRTVVTCLAVLRKDNLLRESCGRKGEGEEGSEVHT
jgi:hypothetical protein